MELMTTQQLIDKVPAVITKAPSDGLSNSYRFVSTLDVAGKLKELAGLEPVAAHARKPGDLYGVHCVTFADPETLKGSNAPVVPQVVVYNAHDGSMSLRVLAGFFRFVCANGLVAGDKLSETKRRHRGEFDLESLIAGTLDMVDAGKEEIAAMRGVKLDTMEQCELARSMANIVWAEEARTEKLIQSLVTTVRRVADLSPDLWTVFNRIQENILRGGMDRGVINGRASTTRGIRDMQRRLDINQGIWDVATARLKDRS